MQQTTPKKIVQLNKEGIKKAVKELVQGSMEETLIKMYPFGVWRTLPKLFGMQKYMNMNHMEAATLDASTAA